MNDLQQQVKNISQQGRFGDTTLVHMSPAEVRGLAQMGQLTTNPNTCLLYTSPSPRDKHRSRMPSSA